MPSRIQALKTNQAQNEQGAKREKNYMVKKNSTDKQEVYSEDDSGNQIEIAERGDGERSGAEVRSTQDNDIKDTFGNLRSSISKTKVINQSHGDSYSIFNADSCDAIKGIPDNSVHLQVMSPPFADLFVYSNSNRDMGNCKNYDEFFSHYSFLVKEQFRVSMPGRICAIHVMQLPTLKSKHGVIGIRDFRGECIRLFVSMGWIYHSEVCIWKNPVVAMQRTKAIGLLHKQIKKDSCMSRQGVADYLIVFRKPGENPERVTHTNESFPIPVWQRYASPVWASFESEDNEGFLVPVDVSKDDGDDGAIDQGNTLQREQARDCKDEKHLCCLQLGVIKRAVALWSNPGDVVFSPFAGIGSEGYQSIKMGRKFIGIELKPSYFRVACENLAMAQQRNETLFV